MYLAISIYSARLSNKCVKVTASVVTAFQDALAVSKLLTFSVFRQAMGDSRAQDRRRGSDLFVVCTNRSRGFLSKVYSIFFFRRRSLSMTVDTMNFLLNSSNTV